MVVLHLVHGGPSSLVVREATNLLKSHEHCFLRQIFDFVTQHPGDHVPLWATRAPTLSHCSNFAASPLTEARDPDFEANYCYLLSDEHLGLLEVLG